MRGYAHKLMIKRLLIPLLLIIVLLPASAFAAKRSHHHSSSRSGKRVRTMPISMRSHRHLRSVFVPSAGIVVENMQGDILMAEDSDAHFNPASVMKVATSLVALEKLGYDYRFPTEFYTNGQVNEEGILQGDLIVNGSADPDFLCDNTFLVIDKLHNLGIKAINGDLVVLSPFYLNRDASTTHSAQQLLSLFQGRGWSSWVNKNWADYCISQGRAGESFVGLEFTGHVRVDQELDANAQHILTHQSRPLADILKIQNNHSSNFMAEAIGRYIGGPTVIEQFLAKKVGITKDEINVVTASGLGTNWITPKATIKLMRSFYSSVTNHSYRIEDLLPAAGVDEGTLEQRFTREDLRGSVVAKTGTLGGHNVSALAGFAYTKEQGVIIFAILNRDIIGRARSKQDDLVGNIIYQCGGPSDQVRQTPLPLYNAKVVVDPNFVSKVEKSTPRF